MTNPRKSWNSLALFAALLLLTAGCGGGKTTHASRRLNAAASPPQLKSIQQLRSVFNAASREPTLVVLVAPT
ncbi:MAG: hypothetical protein ACRDQ1_17100 [Sciscionella sp.]